MMWQHWNFWDYQDECQDVWRQSRGDKSPNLSDIKEFLEDAESDDFNYHQADRDADYMSWSGPTWTAEEATALSFGKDPHTITHDLVETFGGIFAFAFAKLADKIYAAQKSGELPMHIKPQMYVRWADSEDIPFPDELRELGEPLNPEVEALWKRLEREIALKVDLQSQLGGLRQSIEASSTSSSPGDRTLHRFLSPQQRGGKTKMDDTLRKLAAGLLLVYYGTWPETVSELVKDLAAKKVSIDRKTLTDHLERLKPYAPP